MARYNRLCKRKQQILEEPALLKAPLNISPLQYSDLIWGYHCTLSLSPISNKIPLIQEVIYYV
jgi:hypothetical protein